MPERPQQLAHLEHLGDAAQFAAKMQALIPKCNLLENFSSGEVQGLAQFMHAYRAETGVEIIREGDGGDFMLMLIEGRVEVYKRDRWNTPQLLATVEPGRTLGEMSMIDGDARFATCVAAEPALLDAWYGAHPAGTAAGFFLLYVALTGLSIPGAAVLTLVAGAIFGVARGTLLVSFASALGATIAFLVSRFVLRDWVRSRYRAQLEAIDRGVQRE